MAVRGERFGDVSTSAPDRWVAPFTGGAEPHAVLVLAADDPGDLEARQQRLQEIMSAHGVSVLTTQDGIDRPGDQSGHEHFGFKDAISQPGIQGFTTSSKGEAETAPAGEFILGYPDADGHISGQPSDEPPPPESAYNPTPTSPPSKPLPPWTRHGSFVVYRRLRQDVASFRQAMIDHEADSGLTRDQLAAKLVGRWPSGAPMEHVPGEPHDLDPSVADPSVVYPQALDKQKINDFDYDDDPDGLKVPRAAHIRKVNPRSDQLPDGDRSQRHRMLRRGPPYGLEFQEGESPYGGTVPDTQDRGLLFICYQASIERTFEFVQARWANAPNFPQTGDGQDPIAAQSDQRPFQLPPDKHISFAPWVTTTGGGYFFSPSFSGLRLLISPELGFDSSS